MQRALSVIAVVDTTKPPRWINLLASQLDARQNIQLAIVCLPADRQTELSPEQNSPAQVRLSLAERLANHVLHDRIDKPLFSQNPWLAEELFTSPSIEMIRLADASQPIALCDVVLNLTESGLPDSLWPPATIPVWDPHVETLDARVENALLSCAPLNWVHLWSHVRQDMADGSAHDNGVDATLSRRIASHALPRQSFSLTDLRRAAWFSLPSLIDSRLNWMAHSADPGSVEYTESSPVDGRIMDPEVLAAHAEAEQLALHRFLPPAMTPYTRLVYALNLLYRQSIERLYHLLWYQQWQLGYRNDGPCEPFHDTDNQAQADTLQHSPQLDVLVNGKVSDFISIDSPDRVWWADPHLYKHNDELYVFFEEMSMGADHGHLSVARLNDNGRVDQVTKVMDGENHLSYPFVFSHGGEVYMIPETASEMSVQLFRASQFPQHWEKVSNLLSDVNLADSTVHFDGSRWWMFSNGMSHCTVDERDELHLFHAETLSGPWLAHPMNPVVTGVDRARMAGSLIRDANHLYRPSQFGARRYGYGINLHRIDQLDMQGYAETLVGRLLPEPGSQWIGCHSTSHLDGVTVVDRAVRRRR